MQVKEISIKPVLLKEAKRLLGTKTDIDTVNKALEIAIEVMKAEEKVRTAIRHQTKPIMCQKLTHNLTVSTTQQGNTHHLPYNPV